MEIRKKGNLISALLTNRDFDAYDIYPNSLKEEDKHVIQDKVKCVIHDIIESADEEIQEEIKGHDMKVEVIVPNVHSIIINLHLIENLPENYPYEGYSPEAIEEANNFFRNLMQRMEEENRNNEEEDSYNEKIIIFDSLSDAIEGIKNINPDIINKSDLLKNENKFYLYVNIKDEFIDKFEILSIEFFNNQIYDKNKIAYIIEHAEIITKDAINKLSKI